MNNETGVKKGLTTQKCSKTKMVTHTTGTFGWSVPFLRHFRRYITCPDRQLPKNILCVLCALCDKTGNPTQYLAVSYVGIARLFRIV